MAMVDITIRGAGIFGLSVGWACAMRGASVRVVDPGGVGAGASGGIVGALAPHVPENWNAKKAFQLDSLLMAERFWQRVEEASCLSAGYGRLGRLQPIADEHALGLARARAETAKPLWQGRAAWQVIRADTAGDWAPRSASGWLIHDTLSARMFPRHACAALAAALRAKGTEIVAEHDPEGKTLWATGEAGLAEIGGMGIKGQAALLRLAMPEAPQLFADTLHIIPHANGTVAIGSTNERDYTAPDTTDSQLDDIINRARAALPMLQDAPILERWAGVRPRSASRAPVLGNHPTRLGEYIANGGFKIGFGMAPKVAEVMAELMLNGRDTIPDDFKAQKP